ncbi:hypothetical protein MTO96_025421 [Rhipicephalus appendiculatus]
MYIMCGGVPLCIETLVYKASDSSCGIISARPLIRNSTIHIDLRVNSTIHIDLRVRSSAMRAIFLVLVAQMKLPDGFLPAIHVHSYRIRDFMNTRESIWTYNTTKIKDVHCRYDLMRFIDSGFIAFNRTMLRNRQRMSLELLGEFSSRRVARMHIFHGPLQLSTETLVYKTPDSSCGVIVVRSFIQGSSYVDLRNAYSQALHVDSYRIRDFLNTKEDIWTYNTTKTNVIRCRIGVELLGQFSRRRLGRMYVFREGHPLSIETLTYKAPDCSCGVVVVRSLTQGSPPRSAICDIKHFLNTSLEIWTYRTTNPKDITCKVDVMSSINQHYITFSRSMILHKRRQKVQLRGEFFRLLPDRMTIYPPAFEEIMLYEAPSSSCAVFKVRIRFPGSKDSRSTAGTF